MFLYKYLQKKLRIRLLRSSGRNNKGRITVYHRGGGHKKFYRFLNFFFFFKEIPFYCIKQEYDPNRNVNIHLVLYFNGFIGYFLKPISSDINIIYCLSYYFRPKIGYIFPLKIIPVGSYIYNIQQNLGSKAVYVRSAGLFAKILKHFVNKKVKFVGYTLIELPSKEKKLFLSNCFAFFGKIDNFRSKYKKKVKAGNLRWIGKRPVVRGVAMNPIDHPHGGNTSGGIPSMSPWGVYTKGKKTRKRKKNKKFIF